MWKPTVKDPILAERISRKIEEISTFITRNKNETYPSLFNGDSGMLLFNCYRSLQTNSFENAEIVENKIIDLFNNLMSVQSGVLSVGVAGILWTLDHLNQEEFIELEEETLADISESLSNSLLKNAMSGNFDYLHGANGIALYLINRPEQEAHVHFRKWLELMYDSAIKTHDTVTWRTLINAKDKIYGNCLGLAHGIPSTILILIKLLERQNDDMALELLDKSINYLLQNQNNYQSPVFFPNYICEGKKVNGSRLGWCYGDLGCAAALLKAGEYLKRKDLTELATKIMLHHASADSELQIKQMLDGDFCHGTVGVAHMFGRFYNATGLEKLRESSEYYYAKTLDMAYHKEGLAGFNHYRLEGYANDYSLLEGISGIGLSLISGTSNIEPKWDACFLLS